MKSELVQAVFSLIESKVLCRPSPMEFEMAYQAKVAVERIRFAIKQTEQIAGHTDQAHEVGLQLLDALDRLESIDRQFQVRSRLSERSHQLNGIRASLGPKRDPGEPESLR